MKIFKTMAAAASPSSSSATTRLAVRLEIESTSASIALRLWCASPPCIERRLESWRPASNCTRTSFAAARYLAQAAGSASETPLWSDGSPVVSMPATNESTLAVQASMSLPVFALDSGSSMYL